MGPSSPARRGRPGRRGAAARPGRGSRAASGRADRRRRPGSSDRPTSCGSTRRSSTSDSPQVTRPIRPSWLHFAGSCRRVTPVEACRADILETHMTATWRAGRVGGEPVIATHRPAARRRWAASLSRVPIARARSWPQRLRMSCRRSTGRNFHSRELRERSIPCPCSAMLQRECRATLDRALIAQQRWVLFPQHIIKSPLERW
jgi:hypothetical protein